MLHPQAVLASWFRGIRHAPGTTHDVRTSICHATGRSNYDEPDEDPNLAYRDAVFTNSANGR